MTDNTKFAWPWNSGSGPLPDPTQAVRKVLADSAPEALRLVEPWLDAWRMPLVWWGQAAQNSAPWWWWTSWPAGQTASAGASHGNASAAASAAAAPAQAAASAMAAVAAKQAAPRKVKTTKRVVLTAAAPTSAKTPVAKKASAPRKAAPAKRVAPDDLTRVEGIGPKIAAKLRAAGIEQFASLAKASTSQLQAVLDKAGTRFNLARPETWAEQANLLARGKFAEFEKLAAQLRGGVRV